MALQIHIHNTTVPEGTPSQQEQEDIQFSSLSSLGLDDKYDNDWAYYTYDSNDHQNKIYDDYAGFEYYDDDYQKENEGYEHFEYYDDEYEYDYDDYLDYDDIQLSSTRSGVSGSGGGGGKGGRIGVIKGRQQRASRKSSASVYTSKHIRLKFQSSSTTTFKRNVQNYNGVGSSQNINHKKYKKGMNRKGKK